LELGSETAAIAIEDMLTSLQQRRLNLIIILTFTHMKVRRLKDLDQCWLETGDLETVSYPSDQPDGVDLR